MKDLRRSSKFTGNFYCQRFNWCFDNDLLTTFVRSFRSFIFHLSSLSLSSLSLSSLSLSSLSLQAKPLQLWL